MSDSNPNQRPQVTDYAAWSQMVMEHRRILLERVIAEFPEVLKTKKSTVENLRRRIRCVLT